MLTEHFGYLSDAVKLRRYGDAIPSVIRPGDVVLDIGCGSGVLGLACLRAGAGLVHFIDKTAFIAVARRTVERAGYAARARFHRARAQRAVLPERVDVIVCDHVGHFGIDYGILGMMRDAADRFLKPGGRLVPAELRLSLAAVESASCRAWVSDWRSDGIPADYHWVGEMAAHTVHAAGLNAGELLSAPVTLATLVLGKPEPPFLSWSVELSATRDGHLDGLAGWFECRLAGDVWMTNSPLAPEPLTRAQAFLPLSAPVPIRAGDTVRVTIMSRPDDHLLGWVVSLPRTGQRWSHSTWNGRFLEPRDLVRAYPDRTATLNPLGQARQVILGYCDGVRSVRTVEALVLKEHPHLFPSDAELSAFIADVLGQDTE